MGGRIVTVTVFAAFVGWLIRHEVRNYWERKHALRLLREMAEKERRADALAAAQARTVTDDVRDELAALDAFAHQLEEIRALPEFDRLGSWTVDE